MFSKLSIVLMPSLRLLKMSIFSLMTKISFIKLLNIFFKKNIKYKITKSYTKKKTKKIKKIKLFCFFFFFFHFISTFLSYKKNYGHFCLFVSLKGILTFFGNLRENINTIGSLGDIDS
jgi:Na+/H+ antiporter NhaD/arsenite permease-like protein